MTLSNRQRRFVEALVATHGVRLNGYSRQDLIEVCDSSGIYTCPPSWITQDSGRKLSRGVYSVPEASEVSPATTTAPAASTAAPAAPAVPVAPAAAVEAPVAEAVAHDVLGMTGGESATLVPERISTYVPWGHHNDVERIVKTRTFCPLFVTGLSGNGKTTMIDQVCARLGRDLYRVNITTQTDEDDLLGGFRLINGDTVWTNGPVVEAMLNGGVLLLDEIDLASSKIMALQPVLEGKGVFLKKVGRFVKPAPGFTVIATANTKGKGSDDGRFVGTNILNEAFLDRFAFTMEQEYASRATERKILMKWMVACGVGEPDKDFADNLVRWAEIVRKSFADGAVDDIISTRRLKDAVTAWSIFNDRNKAVEMVIARFDEDTKDAFHSLYLKVDAEAGQQVAESAAETASYFWLPGAGYADRESVKSMGAKWDPNKKSWYVSREVRDRLPNAFTEYMPTAFTAAEVTELEGTGVPF